MSSKEILQSAVPQLLGSMKLAVVLLLTLAGVIGFATVLETDHGRAVAQWYVYHSTWFLGLLGLLGVNILFAALVRWPWKRHQFGFVVTHCGLLVLLIGSVRTFLGGIEGQVTLTEGETTTTMIHPHQSQLKAAWVDKPEEAPYHFSFEPGPVNWRNVTTLDVGEVDGVAARVLRYIPKAKASETWVADEAKLGGPSARLQIVGPQGAPSIEQFLVDQDFGDEAAVGPLRFQLRRTASAAVIADFMNPPKADLGQKGVLFAYFGDQVKQIAVDDSVGKNIMLNDGGLAVQIVEYLPNARSEVVGQFKSVGTEPRNPLLELRVFDPKQQTPLRELSFAKNRLLTLDGVTGSVNPVKFEYLHPAIKPAHGLELLQTPQGLLARVCAGDQITTIDDLPIGAKIPLQGQFTCTLVEYLPHTRPKVTFESQDRDVSPKDKAEPAAEIEVTVAGVTQTVWLQRNHPTLGTRIIATPEGMLRVGLGYAESPLGFALRLESFRRHQNPGGVGNAAFASVVRVLDPHQNLDEEREISMNEPLTRNRLTFYQSSFSEPGHGKSASTFSIAYDPGRWLKYAGSLLICLGIAIMFYMRAYFFRPAGRSAAARMEATSEQPELIAAKITVPESREHQANNEDNSPPTNCQPDPITSVPAGAP